MVHAGDTDMWTIPAGVTGLGSPYQEFQYYIL
jgi:hypothetical protein